MGEASEIAKVLDKSIADDIYAVQEDFIGTPLEKEYLRFKKNYFDFMYDIFNGNVPSSLAQSGNNQFKQQLIELKEGLKDPDVYLHGESEEEFFVADPGDRITFEDVVDITSSNEVVASVSDVKEVKKILFGDTEEKASKEAIAEFFKLFEVSTSSGKDLKKFFLSEQEEHYDEQQDEEGPF